MREADLEPREVTLTLDGPTAARLDLEAEDEGVTVREWIGRAIELRFMRVDRSLSRSFEADCTIELPDRVYRRAWLRYKRAEHRGEDATLAEYAHEYVAHETAYVSADE